MIVISRHLPAHTLALRALLTLLAPALLVACRDADVVARVGRTELREADVKEYAAHRVFDPRRAETPLDALAARMRLAEQAREEGLEDRPEVRARIAAARREILAQALLEARLSAAMDENLLRRRYEAERERLTRRRVPVRHLMLRLSPGASQEERRKALERATLLQARITSGEDFAKVAKEASEDVISAERGGDLGTVQEGQVDAAFFEAILGLGQAELSKPFVSGFGVHVAQRTGPVEKRVPSFEEVRGLLAADTRREAEEALAKELAQRYPVKHFREVKQPASEGAAPAKAGAR